MRFPGFNQFWKERRLDQIATIERGRFSPRPRNNPIYYNGDIPFVQTSDVVNSNGKIDSYSQTLNERGLKVSKLFPKGAILITIAANIGYSGVLQKDMACPDSLVGLKCNPETSNAFLNYIFMKEQPRMDYLAVAAAQKNINIEFLKPYKVFIATLNEQIRIATFLSLLDHRIKTQSKIIDQLESLMLGFRQKIFTQELRFKYNLESEFPHWQIKKLGELCVKAKSGGTPKSTIKDYYDGNIPFLAISDMTSQGKYLTSTSKKISQKGIDNSSSWIVPKNSLIYSMYASVGFVSINKIELATSQAVMNLIIKDNVELEFVYYYLKFFQKEIYRYIETGTQGNINASIVKQLFIKLPSIKEQIKIANFLSAFDKKVEKEKLIFEQYQQQKKYLLQNLFI